MSTKAQRFRSEQERLSKPSRPKKPRPPRRDTPVDTSLPGVSATDRHAARGTSGSLNVSNRAGRRGGAALEESASGKPSRKSTRKSAGRIKRTSNLQRRAIRKTSSSKERATRAKVRA